MASSHELVVFRVPPHVWNWWMLPSGSTRPLQPTRNARSRPASLSSKAEANSDGAAGEAGVSQELLGLREIAGRALAALVVEGADRRDRRAARRVLTVPRDLVQRLAVDREIEGLAHARIVGQRGAEVAGRLGLAGLVVL